MAKTSTTISAGRMFRVTTIVNEDRLEAMQKAPELAQQALGAGARFWHDGILPKHFTGGASARYRYAGRARNYLRQKRKAGKPALIYSGTMRQQLKGAAAYSVRAGSAQLKMFASALNFAPQMAENDQNLYVKHKNGRGFPNMKREIKAITDDEREAVAQVTANQLTADFGGERAPLIRSSDLTE